MKLLPFDKENIYIKYRNIVLFKRLCCDELGAVTMNPINFGT